MISYRALGSRVQRLGQLAQIVNTYCEVVGPLPGNSTLGDLPILELMIGLVQQLDELFPVHESMLWEYDEEHAHYLLDLPFSNFVHFEGLDPDLEWDDLDFPFQLVFALFEAGPQLGYVNGYTEDARRWWQEQSGHHLPPLAVMDHFNIHGRLQDLPEPWNGLWFILQWCEADTGNLFVDVPCAYAHEMDLSDLDWSIKTIHRLEYEYQDAENRIFKPALALADLCRLNPEAQSICFDLVLGRPLRYAWLIQDGELIITEVTYAQQ